VRIFSEIASNFTVRDGIDTVIILIMAAFVISIMFKWRD